MIILLVLDVLPLTTIQPLKTEFASPHRYTRWGAHHKPLVYPYISNNFILIQSHQTTLEKCLPNIGLPSFVSMSYTHKTSKDEIEVAPVLNESVAKCWISTFKIFNFKEYVTTLIQQVHAGHLHFETQATFPLKVRARRPCSKNPLAVWSSRNRSIKLCAGENVAYNWHSRIEPQTLCQRRMEVFQSPQILVCQKLTEVFHFLLYTPGHHVFLLCQESREFLASH